MDTSNYQQCSNLVKMCSINAFNPKKAQSFLINLLAPLGAKILKIPLIYRKILQRYGAELISFKQNTNFLINLNIRSNFISDNHNKTNLFGLGAKKIEKNQHDLLALDYVFELCFMRDEDHNTHSLVISANLKPSFRELIAKEIIQIMNSHLSEHNILAEQSDTKSNDFHKILL